MRCKARRVIPGECLVLCLAVAFACSQARLIKTDPFFDTFFEKTSLLMTEEEIDLYLHLPDREAKAEFIADFWRIRDPDPTTAENENRMEFERRVKFANEWFGAMGQTRRKPAPSSIHRDRGWDTDRGVAYIVLGPPDSISMTWSVGVRDQVAFDDGYHLAASAVWYYERFRLPLYFASFNPQDVDPETDELEKSFRPPETKIRTLSTNSEKMEQAKAEWISRDHRRGFGEPLRFKAEFRERALEISIPMKAIRFRENEDKTLAAAFSVDARIYRNNRKVDQIASQKTFTLSEKEAEQLSSLDFLIPYDPPGKGKYLFDLVVSADDSSVLSRRRQYIRVKL
jgi:GWxTD domain-containing protein